MSKKFDDKSTWGQGPWQDEPDAIDFYAYGLKCAMRRGPTGAWCGYVALPAGHPLWGKSYGSEVENPPQALLERPIDMDKVGVINLFCNIKNAEELARACELALLIDVHGGLTWAGARLPADEKDGELWWLGFDCCHGGDASPRTDAALRHVRETPGPSRYDVYRDMAYVRGECASLAKQLCGWDKLEPRRDPDSRDLDLE